MDYVRCMTITQNVDPVIYNYLTDDNYQQIYTYIDDPMTATTFPEEKAGKNSRQVVTAEVIYSWMIALNIPVEFHKWHLNSLLTLIRACNALNAPPKKRSKKDILRQNAALNAARKKQFNTRG